MLWVVFHGVYLNTDEKKIREVTDTAMAFRIVLATTLGFMAFAVPRLV